MRMPSRISMIIFGVGFASAGIGYITGVGMTREKFRKEYEQSAVALRNAMEKTHAVETPAATEAELLEQAEVVVDMRGDDEFHGRVHNPDEVAYAPSSANPYHVAISAVETPVEVYVNGEPNEYGISYIEEEDYLEEDGRFKGSITILMDAHNPSFFMDGVLVDDWAERLGASIVKDFLTYIPAGTRNPVLYVRNHRTDHDYEITPENP